MIDHIEVDGYSPDEEVKDFSYRYAQEWTNYEMQDYDNPALYRILLGHFSRYFYNYYMRRLGRRHNPNYLHKEYMPTGWKQLYDR